VFADSSWVENIYRIDVSSPKARITPLIESSRVEESGQFSPDGKSLAFQSTRTGSFEIFRANADGSNQLQLTHLNGPLTGTPNWGSDGKLIVFDSRVGGNADIFAVPSEGGSLRQLTKDPSNEVVPSVSRDGKSIYFASDRGGFYNVWKMPIEGGTATQITHNGGFFARESPDGQWIYYAKSVSTGGIWRVPTAGGKEEFVMKNLDGYWGYWALSATGIYFVGGRDLNPTELDFYDLASKRTTKVLDIPKPVNSGAPGLGISPDGNTLTLTLLESRSSDIIFGDGLK
jgi:Tol biopolymer transport system component